MIVFVRGVGEHYQGTHSSWNVQTRGRLHSARARSGAAVIVPFAETRNAVVGLYRVAISRANVIPLGVDTQVMFHPLSKNVRMESGS